MLSMYGIIAGEIIIGVALMILLFASSATAGMNSDPSSKSNSEVQSDRSETPTQQSQTDITNTMGQPNDLPPRATVMPVARGREIDVDNELIGDTVRIQKEKSLGD